MEPIYKRAKEILNILDISSLTAKYYAELVRSYTIFNLSRFDQPKLVFHVLCFVSYRYLKINDDLVKTYFAQVDKYQREIKKTVDTKILEQKTISMKYLNRASKIFDMFLQDKLDDKIFSEVKESAYGILDKNKITQVRNWLAKNTADRKRYEWEEYDNKYNAIKRNTRPIIKALDFSFLIPLPNSKRIGWWCG